MTINEFIALVEQHPFILYYYGFSMILSIVLGRFFLSRMGYVRIWNYFFSFLLYVMTVVGMYSLILFAFRWMTDSFRIDPAEVLIPFLTMLIALFLIRNKVNISLLTGFGNFFSFYIVLFFISLGTFILDYTCLVLFFDWSIFLFLLFFMMMTMGMQRLMYHWVFQKKN